MINYKSFKISDNAKLRVRADHIVATVSSKNNNTVDLYVSGIAVPWHLSIEGPPSKVMDYVWERHNIEEEGDND